MLQIISIPIPPFKTESNDPLVAKFIGAARRMKEGIERAGRVYSTFVFEMDCIFMTASKDTHLEFGVMPLDGQIALAEFLFQEFDARKIEQALLVFDKGERECSRALIVTRTFDAEEGTVFFLAPTR